MKERAIIFSGDMVRAILDGEKAQTRRIVKPQPVQYNRPDWPVTHGWREVPHVGGWEVSWNQNRMTATEAIGEFCPYGVPGDRLWVREAFFVSSVGRIIYAADRELLRPKSPIHMPRWASRITLEVTGVRVQRLQDITEDDARAEGFDSLDGFALLWDRINEKCGYGWQDNPWVWAVEFRAVTA